MDTKFRSPFGRLSHHVSPNVPLGSGGSSIVTPKERERRVGIRLFRQSLNSRLTYSWTIIEVWAGESRVGRGGQRIYTTDDSERISHCHNHTIHHPLVESYTILDPVGQTPKIPIFPCV